MVKKTAAALAALMIMSGCASAPNDGTESCETLADYIRAGQPTDTRVDVLVQASKEAEDQVLRDRLDTLRAAHVEKTGWDDALESVAERCIELKALQA